MINNTQKLFQNKKLNHKKLLEFGFNKHNDEYKYLTNIASGQFKISITITTLGTVSTKLFDPLTNEEYVLHRIPSACGSFIGMVRTDYEKILQDISDKCFELDIFKSDYAKQVIKYVQNTYQDQLEFLWSRSPENAIFRRKDTGKWYGVLLTLSKRKLGLDSDDIISILDLKIKPLDIELAVDYKKYYPGYHMNKKHWITVCLDGSVAMNEISKRIDDSYNLAVK